MSATYYAVFHAGLRAAADLFAGAGDQTAPLYGLAYRSIDHGKRKSLCQEVMRPSPSLKYQRYVPKEGWDLPISDYAQRFIMLDEQRMLADYDPGYDVAAADAETQIRMARTAIQSLENAGEPSKRAFLTLLLFPPR
ncbi:hypothetical protein DK419_01090 [Methylobacterium terrae]|uniref:HEPN domain-containing protein n=1 Tax=Methylobacterium terrae TaxID=2202827 RepID=A0A2U8WHS3_9HYPH|nr:hypothetical protein [Methylobacterium terrae]AWN45098.1 hypothetical protein DK419_01090 [Methylobacterium terrae]